MANSGHSGVRRWMVESVCAAASHPEGRMQAMAIRIFVAGSHFRSPMAILGASRVFY